MAASLSPKLCVFPVTACRAQHVRPRQVISRPSLSVKMGACTLLFQHTLAATGQGDRQGEPGSAFTTLLGGSEALSCVGTAASGHQPVSPLLELWNPLPWLSIVFWKSPAALE